MTLYVRDTRIAIVRPGHPGQDMVGERFEQGGSPETGLLPVGDEIDMHRVVVPDRMPDGVIAAMAGRRLRDVMETPDAAKGFSPRDGNDHGHDELFRIRDGIVSHARAVERGTLIAVEGGRTCRDRRDHVDGSA